MLVRTSRNELEDAAEAGVVCLDRVGVQFKDDVAERRVVASSDHRQAAAQLVVPDAALVHRRSFQIQVELEPIRTSVVQYRPIRTSNHVVQQHNSLIEQQCDRTSVWRRYDKPCLSLGAAT